MTDVTPDVVAIIAKKVPEERRGAMQPTDKLQDLGIESIDALEMIFDIEEKFGVQVPYNANDATSEFSTVADVAAAVQKLVDQKASTAGAAG
jgi:acyl carrier protein